MAARPWPSDPLIWALSGALATAGALLWWLGPALPEVGPHVWWPVLAAAVAVSERFAVHLPFGRDTHSLTFSQAPLVVGLFLLSLDELLLATVAGVVVSQVVGRRNPPIKVAYNVASNVAQVSLATVVFTAALDWLGAAASSLSPATWAAALAATLTADLLGNLALFVIISLRQARWDASELARTLVAAAVGTVVVTDLALVTVLVMLRDGDALWLLAVVGVLSFLLYQGYHVQRLRYGRLQLLYRFTSSVDQALQDRSVPTTVTAEARELLRARTAEVVPLGTDGAPDGAWWAAAAEGSLVRLTRGGDTEAHRALRLDGHLDGMAAPVREDGDIVGVLLVADRLDDVSTFDPEDARLFEALAGHASVALANSGLVDRVRAAASETEHLALHDPLTGLANRLNFQQRLERRLASTGSAAVLLMDIDRFKEVNDTLGHDTGDRLIQLVAERLRSLEGDETTVARLGGDEFAILLGGDDVHIEGMVARINRDFSRPFELGDVTLDVSASIGIAATPDDGSSAALLLRRAEVAMYDAKGGLAGVARYSPDRDPYSSRRLSLIGDLARALEEGTLALHYQPQAEPESGRITGVEALLRWHHPLWGHVPPDEFIPLAEHTGMIKPLTQFVLETAVRQCVAWRDAGTPVLMAVNISMRNLLEPELADTVARLLLQAGLPAALLKLEVTESAIVAEPERAVQALQRLVDLGLSVSVDDFGTGYSSLTRLRNLPVQEVKVDRTFVRHLADDGDDLAIVRAVISLGHDLGLRVVAEGVEDERSWRILQDLGCDLVQGYFLAKPMPAEAMSTWLADRMAGFATRLRAEQVERDEPSDRAASAREVHGQQRQTGTTPH
ncbi:MAG TPA: EAL domain-containing protein [Actinomycetes bacterium]|nr:EAL domain-containing protein [Actinomycetes bacterium]